MIGHYREYADVLRATVEVSTYDQMVRAVWDARVSRFTEHTLTLLRSEQEEGRTPAAINLAGAVRIIVVGGERAILDQVTSATVESDPHLARELALTWWHGIFRRP